METLSIILSILYILMNLIYMIRSHRFLGCIYGKYNSPIHIFSFVLILAYFYVIVFRTDWYLYNIITILIGALIGTWATFFAKRFIRHNNLVEDAYKNYTHIKKNDNEINS